MAAARLSRRSARPAAVAGSWVVSRAARSGPNTRSVKNRASAAARLAADPISYPPPGPAGWSLALVDEILSNPKYTGHQVMGRRRRTIERLTPLAATAATTELAQAPGAPEPSTEVQGCAVTNPERAVEVR